MSDIHTLAELQEAMSKDFAWRKKELIGLKSLVISNKKTGHRDLFVRAAITILYAHWEGFVKRVGLCYLEFVSRKRLKHDLLKPSFLAMAVRRLVDSAAASSKIQRCLDVVGFFQSSMKTTSDLPWETAISTKANLNSEAFKEIVLTLGLDYSSFETKENLLDEKLLAHRNNIAHGERLLVGYDEYLDLHHQIFMMMQDYYNQIDNAALQGSYRL